MKRFFLVLVAFLGISFAANAQQGVCKVTNGNGATVVVNVVNYYEDGRVELSISSDCDDYVNVSFTFRFQYDPTNKYKTQLSQPFTVSAQPNSDTSKTVTIRLPKVLHAKLVTIEEVRISGARCQ